MTILIDPPQLISFCNITEILFDVEYAISAIMQFFRQLKIVNATESSSSFIIVLFLRKQLISL